MSVLSKCQFTYSSDILLGAVDTHEETFKSTVRKRNQARLYWEEVLTCFEEAVFLALALYLSQNSQVGRRPVGVQICIRAERTFQCYRASRSAFDVPKILQFKSFEPLNLRSVSSGEAGQLNIWLRADREHVMPDRKIRFTICGSTISMGFRNVDRKILSLWSCEMFCQVLTPLNGGACHRRML